MPAATGTLTCALVALARAAAPALAARRPAATARRSLARRLLAPAAALALARAGLAATRLLGRAVGVELGRLAAQLKGAGALVGGHDLPHEALAVAQVAKVVAGHKGKRPPRLTGAARAPDAVDVVFWVGRHIKVDHVAHVRHVDAARQHVGGHEHIGLAVAEARQRALALVLAAVSVNRRARDARAAQAPAAGVGTVLGAREDDDVAGALGLEHLRKQGVLGLERHGQHELVDRVGHGALVGDLHDGRVAHEVADAADGSLVKRGREEHRLARGRRLTHNLAHRGEKAHVKHAVGLVEHERLDLVEVGLALLDEVDETAGRGHEDVAAAVQGGLLRLVAQAAHHRHAAVMRALGDGLAGILNLLGKLARGRHHEHERAVVARRARQAAHGRQEEGGRLAGAGLGGGQQIAALERVGDGLRLNGRGCLVAKVAHGLEDGVGKAEVGEGGGVGCGAGGLVRGRGGRVLLRCLVMRGCRGGGALVHGGGGALGHAGPV